MGQNVFIILIYLPLALLIIILFFNILIGLKYMKLWRKITVEYPKLENKMLAFRRFQNPYGFVPFAHPDYIIPIIKRFFLLESFSKSKTQKFYKMFYQIGSVKQIKDKEISKDLEFIITKSPVRDILVSIFFILLIIMFIIGIVYSFSQ